MEEQIDKLIAEQNTFHLSQLHQNPVPVKVVDMDMTIHNLKQNEEKKASVFHDHVKSLSIQEK